jgi:DNA-binding transcriptional MerR regulator
MLISELAAHTGVDAKTIRYYESIGLIPKPKRSANSYRQFTPADIERLRFIASGRALGFSIADVREILAARDCGEAPCRRVLDTLSQRMQDIDRRISALLALRETLSQLRRDGETLPPDEVLGEHCVCYLLKSHHESGQVVIKKKELAGD